MKYIVHPHPVPLVLALLLFLFTAGCGESAPEIDAQAVLRSLLGQVAFDTELSEVGEYAALYFPALPEGTGVQLYTGSGYYADEAALLTLPEGADGDGALQAVRDHIAELQEQYRNYLPAEVEKIDRAVIRQSGRFIFLCITDDSANAALILDHAADPSYQLPGRETQPEPKITDNGEPDPEKTDHEPLSSPVPAEEYPAEPVRYIL